MQSALRDIRKTKGWSQQQLAAGASVPQGRISLIERGASEPTLNIARRLARALEMPLDDLFPEDSASAAT